MNEIDAKLRVDYVTPDLATPGSFVINGSANIPEDHHLELGKTYYITIGDEVNDDPIPVPEPGTEQSEATLPGQEPVTGA